MHIIDSFIYRHRHAYYYQMHGMLLAPFGHDLYHAALDIMHIQNAAGANIIIADKLHTTSCTCISLQGPT